MVITKEVEVKWYHMTKKHYEDLGYIFTKTHGLFTVPIEHLYKGSVTKIEVKCDYCGITFTRRYADHTYIQNKQIVKKDACKKCGAQKTKDSLTSRYGVGSMFELEEYRDKAKATFMDRYGVDNAFAIDGVVEKIKATTLERYGVESYTQTEEYRIKSAKTSMERYGVDNPSKNKDVIQKIKDVQFDKYEMFYSQTDECKERLKQTSLDKYGVENPFQSQEVKDRIVEFNLETYGDHPMRIESIREDRIRKMVQTKHRNGTAQSSRQQDYIAQIIGGDINFPVDNIMLDIKLDDNTFVEYDGSGHNLSVQFGDITKEDFEIKEMRRKYFLINKGWREIRIISNKDFIPSDEVLKQMIDGAIVYLNSGHSWIKYNINEELLICSQYEKSYNFGVLRRIKKEDIIEDILNENIII